MSTSGGGQNLDDLLEKSAHYDPDVRYMATHDLIGILEGTELSAERQARVRTAVVKQLSDKSPDVQTVAVRCLSSLAHKLSAEQLSIIVKKLGSLVVNPAHESNREVYAMGVKALVTALGTKTRAVGGAGDAKQKRRRVSSRSGTHAAASAGKPLLSFLLEALSRSAVGDAALQRTCLDLLREVLASLGAYLSEDSHDGIQARLSSLIEAKNGDLRHRAGMAFGALAQHLSNKAFESAMRGLIARATSEAAATSTAPTVQAISLICQMAGHRVGPFLGSVVPVLEAHCGGPVENGDDAQQTEAPTAALELWVNCLRAFGSVFTKCGAQSAPFAGGIAASALRLLNYDPNYMRDAEQRVGPASGDDSDGGDGGWGDMDEDEDFLFPSNADVGDDDDDAWKVRRAAARCLCALAEAVPSALAGPWPASGESANDTGAFARALTRGLVSRFQERDPTVAAQVIAATRSVVAQTPAGALDAALLGAPTDGESSLLQRVARQAGDVVVQKAAGLEARCEAVRLVLALVQRADPARRISRVLFPTELKTVLDAAATGGRTSGEDSDSIKCNAAELTRACVTRAATTGAASALQPLLPSVTDAMLDVVRSSSNSAAGAPARVAGLRALAAVAKAVSGKSSPASDLTQKGQAAVELATGCVARPPRKVQVAAIETLADIITSVLGQSLPARAIDAAYRAVALALDAEPTRPAALGFVSRTIESRKAPSGLLACLNIQTLVGLLRHSSREVRHGAISALSAVQKSVRTAADEKQDASGVAGRPLDLAILAAHVTDNDLNLAVHVLKLVSATLQQRMSRGGGGGAAAGAMVSEAEWSCLTRVLGTFVRSPLLGGAAIGTSLAGVCRAMAAVRPGAQDLAGAFLDAADAKFPQRNMSVLAQCTAAVAGASSAATAAAVVRKAAARAKDESAAQVQRQVGLQSLAACAREGVVSKVPDRDAGSLDELCTAFLVRTGAADGGLKADAARALGSLAAGDPARFFDRIVALFQRDAQRLPGYLVLCALCSCADGLLARATRTPAPEGSVLASRCGSMADLAESFVDAKDEGTRYKAAECLGLLMAACPGGIIPRIRALGGRPKAPPRAREASLLAVKHAVLAMNGRRDVVDALRGELNGAADEDDKQSSGARLGELFRDEDAGVRARATATLSAVIRSGNLSLFHEKTLRATVIPALYTACAPDPSLIRIITFGNMSQKVDDGLPVRRSALQALGALFAAQPALLAQGTGADDFMRVVVRALSDDEGDINVLAWELVARVAGSDHVALLVGVLDAMTDQMMRKVVDLIKQTKAVGPHSGQSEEEQRRQVEAHQAVMMVLRHYVRGLLELAQLPGADRCSKFTGFLTRVKRTKTLVQIIDDMKDDEQGGKWRGGSDSKGI